MKKKVVAKTDTPTVVEPVVEPVVELRKIILHFTKPVEITINGKHYDGKDVEVPNYAIASEVARIAREAYGNEIL